MPLMSRSVFANQQRRLRPCWKGGGGLAVTAGTAPIKLVERLTDNFQKTYGHISQVSFLKKIALEDLHIVEYQALLPQH